MRNIIAAAMLLAFALVTPALSQSTYDTERAATMAVCTDVIAVQYASDEDPPPRWMDCVNAVKAFLDTIGAPSAEADPAIVLLIEELVELYRYDPDCKINRTELPIAIRTAAEATFDADAKALYLEIYEQIMTCEYDTTAAIGGDQASPN